MEKFKYKVLREHLHVQQYFEGFVLKWTDLPARFFELVYATLGQRLNIQPGELSVQNGNALGEVRARYTIYGGATSVSLMADRIAFDFPGITAPDLALVYEIMGSVHDRFSASFPEIKFGRVEVQDLSHLDLGSQENVTEFFSAYQLSELGESFASLPSQIICGPKFSVTSEDGRWRCNGTVEPSQLSSTAIFASLSSSLFKTADLTTYLEKSGLIQEITQRCLNALKLEIDVGAPQ